MLFLVSTGVDVMITIFYDFWQFSAKNWRFSQKPMLSIKILHNLPSFLSQKRQFFCQILGKKIFFKIITLVPGQGKDHLDLACTEDEKKNL
jgi:hypothetical protein